MMINVKVNIIPTDTWWRHRMETFFALLAICAGNSPVTGEFPAQRPVTRSFDVSFDLRLIKWLSKQSWGWLFETPSRSLWRNCNVIWRRLTIQGLYNTVDSIWIVIIAATSHQRHCLKLLATGLFVQQHIHPDNKGNTKVPHYWPSVRENPVGFPAQRTSNAVKHLNVITSSYVRNALEITQWPLY